MAAFCPTLSSVRADRLVALILLLQARRRATAAELAAELEVSERTIRRDLEALMVSGVPVYPQRGRGGGWALLGGHKLNVSGLTAQEAEALTLLAGPAALGALGLENDVRSAVRKLIAVLPEPVRERAVAADRLILHDPSGWSGDQPERDGAENLPPLRQALFEGVQVDLEYAKPNHEPTVRRVQPLGLVMKRAAWYLVALSHGEPRTFRVSRVRRVITTAEPVTRPDDFDLRRLWRQLNEEWSRALAGVTVRFSVREGDAQWVSAAFGSWIPIVRLSDDVYEARFPHETSAAHEIARVGGAVEVLSPPSVRNRLAEIGSELLARYGDDPPSPGVRCEPRGKVRVPGARS